MSVLWLILSSSPYLRSALGGWPLSDLCGFTGSLVQPLCGQPGCQPLLPLYQPQVRPCPDTEWTVYSHGEVSDWLTDWLEDWLVGFMPRLYAFYKVCIRDTHWMVATLWYSKMEHFSGGSFHQAPMCLPRGDSIFSLAISCSISSCSRNPLKKRKV